jgi:hypothetical protein
MFIFLYIFLFRMNPIFRVVFFYFDFHVATTNLNGSKNKQKIGRGDIAAGRPCRRVFQLSRAQSKFINVD